ncbi:MAG: ribosomal protein S18-alanine N-acetyltransferase [Paracoccaceae bacterium]
MTPELMAQLHAKCFPERPWSADEFDNLSRQSGCVVQWAPENSGFVVARSVLDEAEILTIAVDPKFRRRGYGRLLMQNLSDHLVKAPVPCATLFLEVSAQNRPAYNLYIQLGFVESGRRKGYYRDNAGQNVDAVVMTATCPLVS